MKLSPKIKYKLLRWIRETGFSVRRVASDPDLVSMIRSRQVDLVVDVGANTGQFALKLRQLGYSGRILSFEPVKSVFERLAVNAANDHNWDVLNLAVGDEVKEGSIHVSKMTLFSSMLQLTPAAAAYEKDS